MLVQEWFIFLTLIPCGQHQRLVSKADSHAPLHLHIQLATCACIHVARHARVYACMFPCTNICICTDMQECMFLIHMMSCRQTSMGLSLFHSCMSLHVCLYVARNARMYTLVFSGIETHCNQHCDQEHWYTYISHYWQMPLDKYTCHMSV